MLARLAALLFVIALPLALVLSGGRWMVLDPDFYARGFVKYRALETTGLSREELSSAARQLTDYFAQGRPVTLQVRKNGQPSPLFNQRELDHLVDVRALFLLGFRVQEISLAYLALYTAITLALRRRSFPRQFASNILAGSVLTLGILAGLGLAAVSDFSVFWQQVHLLIFRNDLWMLDPRTDYLIRLTPEAFWFDVVLQLATLSVASAAALAVAAFAFLRLSRR